MEFALSPEQRAFQDSLTRTLARVCPLDRVRRFAETGEAVATDVWAALSELGVPALLVPEAHGGLGLGLLDAALASEALGAATAPAPFMGSALAAIALAEGGADGQRERWLPTLAGGEAWAGVALSESFGGARGDFGLRGEGARLSGKALFALDTPGAAVILAGDRLGGLHLLDPAHARLTPMPSLGRNRRYAELAVDAAPADPLDAAALPRVRDAAWVLLSADMLGASQVMLDKAVAYAKARVQFGRVIGSFQAVKHMCAEMAAALEPCRALVWYAAYAWDRRLPDAPLAAAHAKAQLSEVSRFVARTATEVHGGMGITDLLGLHYAFKRVGVDRQWLGGPEEVRAHAARLQGLLAA